MDQFYQQFLTEYDDLVKNDLEQLSNHNIDLAADFDYSRAIKMFQDFLSGQTNNKEIPVYVPDDPDFVIAFLHSLKNEILSFPKPLILVMNQWKDVVLLIDRFNKKPSIADFFITVEIDSNTTIPDFFNEIPSIHVDDVTAFLSPNDVNPSLYNNQFHIIITLVDTFPLYFQKNQIFYGLNSISNFFDKNAVLFYPECKKLIKNTFEKTISLSPEDIQQCISYFQTFLNRNVYSPSQKNLFEISPRFIHVLKKISRIIQQPNQNSNDFEMNFIELLNQNQIQDHEFLEMLHNHIQPEIRDLLFNIIHYLFFLNSSDYLSIKTTGNTHKTTFAKSIILSSYSLFVLASEYQPQSPRVLSFLTMLTSKENRNFVFPSSPQRNLYVEPNRFKNTVIKMNYNNDMFGIRVLNWYHEFYALLHYYLYEIYLYDDYKHPYVNLSLMLHLTGSPGIGKSTFIYYFVLRWSQMGVLDSNKFYYGINIYFKDLMCFEKLLILKFDDTIYLMKYKSMNKLMYNITIRYYEIYCINNFEVISITDNYKKNHCSEIKVEIRQSTLTFTISSPNCQEINFFDVFDGNQDTTLIDHSVKCLFCTSYNSSKISSKSSTTFVAPVSHVKEFFFTLLLQNTQDKALLINKALTISKYINLNIRDTLIFANTKDEYDSLQDYLIMKINQQISTNDKIENQYDCTKFKNFIFIISPPKFSIGRYDLANFETVFIHLTSEFARDLVLAARHKNELANEESMIHLLKNFINLNDHKLTGILFEVYGCLELKNPCVFRCTEITSSYNESTKTYDLNYFNTTKYMCTNFCSQVKTVKGTLASFVKEISDNNASKHINFLFISDIPHQPLFDSLIYDSQDQTLYIIQITIGDQHNFSSKELDNIFSNFSGLNILTYIYVHFRPHPLIPGKPFLRRRKIKSVHKCFKNHTNFQFFYAQLDQKLTLESREFIHSSSNLDLISKHKVIQEYKTNLLARPK